MSNDAIDASERFTDRVANYVRYRPGYPRAVVETLIDEAGLSEEAVVVDVGSGTGKSAEIFLAIGCAVYGVEPNLAMRQAAEEGLKEYPRFRNIAGTAEDTTLPAACADLVVAGQAFHWFDPPRARREFARVLRPDGWVALLWNTWKRDTPFLRAYEELLLRFGTDYRQVDHRNVDSGVIQSMFDPASFRVRRFGHTQLLDYAGMEGRLLSSSYVPSAGQPNYAPMLAELQRIFDAHRSAGRVRIAYETELYFGHIAADG